MEHYGENHRRTILLLTLGLGLLTILLFLYSGKFCNTLLSWFRNKRRFHHDHYTQDLSAVSACKNPNCVRCQRYRQVQQRAQQRLAWILHSKDEWKASNGDGDDISADADAASLHPRIPSAVRRQRSMNTSPNTRSSWQSPTVLMVNDLPSQEIVTSLHQEACRYLQEHSARTRIWRALQEHKNDDNSATTITTKPVSWTVNDSPQGHWEVLHLLNQGNWTTEWLLHGSSTTTTELWKDVNSLIRNIPGLMDQCLFGNVVISRIHPGTVIEPHCGPTNVRHRLQLVLEVPSSSPSLKNSSRLSLLVGQEERISWNSSDDVFVFDDSFVHSVRYPKAYNASLSNETRTVLIVDLWHPQLSLTERRLLQQLYPPFSTKNEATKT